MIAWGEMILNDQLSYSVGNSIKLNEEPIVSNPAATTPQSILVGGGRLRQTLSASGYITSADYLLLEADFRALTKRSLAGSEISMTNAYLKDLSMSREIPSGANYNGYVQYTATWVEG